MTVETVQSANDAPPGQADREAWQTPVFKMISVAQSEVSPGAHTDGTGITS
jgi:hypothetical protein